jgi:hypothetical protein
MSPYKEELLEALASCRESLTDYVVGRSMLPIPGAQTLPPADLRQMLNGFWELVSEGIVGQTRELRDLYVTSVFPGLRASGIDAKGIIGGSARTLFHVQAELLQRVSAANRAEAQEWLVQFFSEYLGEAAAVWEGPQ